jgi:hypothetical protein
MWHDYNNDFYLLSQYCRNEMSKRHIQKRKLHIMKGTKTIKF